MRPDPFFGRFGSLGEPNVPKNGRRRRLVRRAVPVPLLLFGGCGGDGDDAGPATYEVVLVVGAAEADPRADTTGFPGVGSDFTEPWTLDCAGDTCTLRREPAAPLGALEELRLTRGEDGPFRGVAEGVTAVPEVEEPSPCQGTAAETWTIEVELERDDDLVVGSVFRIPDALVAGDCFGLDLTLGFSGARVGAE